MKKRVSRDLIIFIILIPVFLWITFEISRSVGSSLPSYSVINRSKEGLSVFYETLKELDYPVRRSLRVLTLEKEGTVQIAVTGGELDINDGSIKNWIGKGGILVYLTSDNNRNIDYGATPEIRGNISIYKYQSGILIVDNVDNLTNEALIKDTHYAYELLEVIHDYSSRGIYFNEAHLYSGYSTNSLWDAIPAEFKYIIYQILIVLAACIYYKGKRFGKPLPLYEEVERTENEYLFSAAALYRAAGAWDLMLDNYYKNFLKTINCSGGNWLEYWKNERLPELEKARDVYEFINNKKSDKKAKGYIQTVGTLVKLKKIYEKRREAYWKTLKKTV